MQPGEETCPVCSLEVESGQLLAAAVQQPEAPRCDRVTGHEWLRVAVDVGSLKHIASRLLKVPGFAELFSSIFR